MDLSMWVAAKLHKINLKGPICTGWFVIAEICYFLWLTDLQDHDVWTTQAGLQGGLYVGDGSSYGLDGLRDSNALLSVRKIWMHSVWCQPLHVICLRTLCLWQSRSKAEKWMNSKKMWQHRVDMYTSELITLSLIIIGRFLFKGSADTSDTWPVSVKFLFFFQW